MSAGNFLSATVLRLHRRLPPLVRAALWHVVRGRRDASMTLAQARVREQIWAPAGSLVRFFGHTARIVDGPTFYHQYRDIFVREVYAFETRHASPLIVDGGSNIGISILYFKDRHPTARVLGFEPDPRLFAALQETASRNLLDHVRLVNAALGGESGPASLVGDASDSGRVSTAGTGVPIRVERLSSYLEEPVDLLKLNIEGQEVAVLEELDSSGRLSLIREIVLEYHDEGSGEQQLGTVLGILARNGFRYVVREWAGEESRASPARHRPRRWSCIVRAWRED
ncbi:MAG: FkbM family methyltransferase [Propionibacteriales bacterium]|nr:FkbM family methyltransferase [Propionibacteriales bacterium]